MKKNYLLYLIGRSGSGKTTIAEALEKALKEFDNQRIQVIDGDVIRAQFGDIFGYSYEERMKCNQVVRVVVQYLLKNDVSVILAQVAAHKEMREKVREQFCEQYIEVYIKCSYEECARRDVKGYYKKQREGEMRYLNGANDVFDIPEHSDIVIDTEKESVTDAVEKIMAYLKEHEYGL